MKDHDSDRSERQAFVGIEVSHEFRRAGGIRPSPVTDGFFP
jgi:hypothetical protein